MIRCVFHWGLMSPDTELPERRVTLQYTKTIELPFFPREDDDFELAGCFPCTVTGSWYYPDQQEAGVNVEPFALQPHEGDVDWAAEHARMLQHGWAYECLDAFSDADQWFRQTWLPQILAMETTRT